MKENRIIEALSRGMTVLTLISMLGLACAVLTGAGCSGDEATENEKVALVPISVGQVRQVKRAQTIPVSGTVVSPYASTYVSFLVAGKVQTVLPREGEYVVEGQLIAAIDPTDYQSALDGAAAQADQARVAAEQAENEYNRMAFLFERKSLARNDFEKFKAAGDAAALKLEAALAAETVQKKRLKDTSLHAPVSGFIAKRLAEPGQAVAVGTPVFEIVRLDPVEILVGVPETDIHLVAVGQKADVTLPAMPDHRFEGTVRVINVSADAGTRTYMTRIAIPNPEYLLRIGMVAEADITGDREIEAITLPADAIVRDPQGAPLVYVYYPEQSRAYSKRVTIGRLIGTDVEITDGLSGDEKIVIAGQDKLRDGAEVAVADSDAER